MKLIYENKCMKAVVFAIINTECLVYRESMLLIYFGTNLSGINWLG